MTTGRPHKLTLIQILALIALFGLVLTIVLPRWLDGAGDPQPNISVEE
jgi:hypothetical protein